MYPDRPDTSMSEAAHMMWSGDCGVLPVVDADQRVVGMITDRDLCMGAHFQGLRMQDMKVADSMSRRVFSCLASDSLEQVVRRMGDEQVRRLPVVDARGNLVGILSLKDLARRIVALDERARARLTLRFLEALASICETRESKVVSEIVPAQRATEQPQMIG